MIKIKIYVYTIMNKIIEDKKFGSKSEEEIHKILESKFGVLLNSKENPEMGKYYEFDKYNEKYFIEVKTRRIKHDEYKTLFFGENKLRKGDYLKCVNSKLRIFYIWNCTDGIYYWEHRSSIFEIKERGRNDRGKNEYKKCIDINQKYIKPLNNLNIK